MRAPHRNGVLTFRVKTPVFSSGRNALPKPRTLEVFPGRTGMHLLLHSAIDVAEPIRRRLAARLAAFDAKAFGQAGLRLAERQAAALGAGIMFRLPWPTRCCACSRANSTP